MKGARKGKSREKIGTDITTPEFYKHYISKLGNLEKENGFKVNIRTYTKIVKEFNKWISNKIIHNPKGVVMPYKLGRLLIVKFKTPPILLSNGIVLKKHIPVDWNSTLKLWEKDEDAKNKKILVRLLNTHTDGYSYQWKRDHKRSTVRNNRVYLFTATRTNKLTLKNELRKEDHGLDYYEIVKYRKPCITVNT